MTTQILRRNVFDVWFANAKESRTGALLSYILQEFGVPSLSEDSLKSLKVKIRSLSQKIEPKWLKSGRKGDGFLKTNSLWLGERLSFPDISTVSIETISHPGSSRRTGRPQKDFESCSNKTKTWRIKHILETSSQEEISMADEVQLRREGKRDSAAIVKELCDFSPRRGTTIKKKRGGVFQAQSKVVFLKTRC
ncbi:hypothetical protein AVEN_15139-1 [Araneus ventricosus]|uniref:Uncharacterized protein n=1 Tax=Araneus ventricosus TaxID=182803 RepID=A0A4Y2KJH9_ARAVE|nr:hypothetical protein AVEN_15139-1 [Araneus ventricosus]